MHISDTYTNITLFEPHACCMKNRRVFKKRNWCATFRTPCIFASKSSKVTDVTRFCVFQTALSRCPQKFSSGLPMSRVFTSYKNNHHFLLSLRGHRVSTKRRHQILFLAILLTSPQLIPFSNTSPWADLLHVCLGLSSFSPAGSNPGSLFRWLHFLPSMYALSNSISVS